MSRRFFTADQHLGHAKVLTLCHRPFLSVEAMNEVILARWQEVVTPEDTVYVIGDFAMGRIHDSLALTQTLPGRKILITGNHDRCSAFYPHRTQHWEDWLAVYQEAGFAEIRASLTLEVAGQPVLLHHFPYPGEPDPQYQDRYAAARPVDEGRVLIHGHIHNARSVKARMVNVGVDVWDFRPVSEDALEKAIRLAVNLDQGATPPSNPIQSLRLWMEVPLTDFAAALGMSIQSVEELESEGNALRPREIERALKTLAGFKKDWQPSWFGILCRACGHLLPTTADRITRMSTTCEWCGAPFRDFP